MQKQDAEDDAVNRENGKSVFTHPHQEPLHYSEGHNERNDEARSPARSSVLPFMTTCAA